MQTDYELEAKQIEESLAAQNLMHFGKQGGFEVRVVNNLNAYDWLSEETTALVREIKHKSKVELPVFELLRLALLYEHGGIAIRLPSILLMEGLGWVEELLREGSPDGAERKALSCQLPDPQIVMLHEDREDGSLWYRDDFVAAKPKARLFITLLKEIAKITKSGVWPYADFNITIFNHKLNVLSFPNIAETLINIF